MDLNPKLRGNFCAKNVLVLAAKDPSLIPGTDRKRVKLDITPCRRSCSAHFSGHEVVKVHLPPRGSGRDTPGPINKPRGDRTLFTKFIYFRKPGSTYEFSAGHLYDAYTGCPPHRKNPTSGKNRL